MPIIAVAAPSDTTDGEWRWGRKPPPHKDYALMKVLYHLKPYANSVPVQAFKWDKKAIVPVNFSALEDQSDTIYIAGHGDNERLYAMGPDATEGVNRLVKVLTDDGSLRKKSKTADISITMLSCRAGLGLHAAVAQKLSRELGKDVQVKGAVGFTWGSIRTARTGLNEVLIQGIPWYMEYGARAISEKDANAVTSSREKKPLSVAGKKKEIDAFKKAKELLEKDMGTIVGKLKSSEINKALDELTSGFKKQWDALVMSQYNLYYPAKTASSLEFDMWFDDIVGSYVSVKGSNVNAREIDSFLRDAVRPEGPFELLAGR